MVYTLVGISVDLWLKVLTYNPDGLVRSLHECLRSHKFKNLIQEQGILSRRDVHKLSSQYIKLALNICLVPFFIWAFVEYSHYYPCFAVWSMNSQTNNILLLDAIPSFGNHHHWHFSKKSFEVKEDKENMKNSKFLKILLSVNAVLALENKTEELPAGCRWTEWVNSDHPSKIDEFSSIDGKVFPNQWP